MDAFDAMKQGEEYGLMVRNAVANSAYTVNEAFGVAVGFVGGFLSALKNGIEDNDPYAKTHLSGKE